MDRFDLHKHELTNGRPEETEIGSGATFHRGRYTQPARGTAWRSYAPTLYAMHHLPLLEPLADGNRFHQWWQLPW